MSAVKTPAVDYGNCDYDDDLIQESEKRFDAYKNGETLITEAELKQ
jgi:hypothetical protein